MNTADTAAHLNGPTVSSRPGGAARPWWRLAAGLLVAAFFIEAVFAGAMISGLDWARKAHALTAAVLIGSSLAAGLAALATLRRTPGGPRLALWLLALAALALVQAVMGALIAKGANLAWLHVPLGVALVALAGQTVAAVRRLGGRA